MSYFRSIIKQSTPSRIAESIPAVTFVLDIFNKTDPGEKDVNPMLYLGIALSKAGGREEEALHALNDALEVASITESSWRNAIWGKAHLSRLLRRMGRTSEAERQEQGIR
jgi:hypothetical protein